MIPACIKLGIYDRAVVARLVDEAGQRKCRPEQLALALISCALEMPEAVLDGADPAVLHPHAMAMARTTGLTVKQRALLELAVASAESDGLVRLSARTAADALGGGDHGAVVARFRALVRKNYLEVVERGERKVATLYRVTERGRAMVGGGAA